MGIRSFSCLLKERIVVLIFNDVQNHLKNQECAYKNGFRSFIYDFKLVFTFNNFFKLFFIYYIAL